MPYAQVSFDEELGKVVEEARLKYGLGAKSRPFYHELVRRGLRDLEREVENAPAPATRVESVRPAPPVRPSPLPSRPVPSPEPDEPEDVEQRVPITPPAATPPTAAPVPDPEPARAERARRPRAGPDRGRPPAGSLMPGAEDAGREARADRGGVEGAQRQPPGGPGPAHTSAAGNDARLATSPPPAPAAADEAPLFSTFTCQACGQTVPTAIYDAHKKTCSPKEVQATLPSESSAGPAAPAIPVPNLDRLEGFVVEMVKTGKLPDLVAAGEETAYLLVVARRGLEEQHIPADRQPADDVLEAWLGRLAKKNAAVRRVLGRPSA